jgi:hypothetical protein
MMHNIVVAHKLRWAAIVCVGMLWNCNDSTNECSKGYKPFDCVENAPATGTLEVKVTISDMNTSVPIAIYRGKVEQNVVVFRDTLTASSGQYLLENGEYSVRASYKAFVGGSLVTVYSIEGGTLSSDSKEYCDGTCYSKGTLVLDASYP